MKKQDDAHESKSDGIEKLSFIDLSLAVSVGVLVAFFILYMFLVVVSLF